MRIQGNEYNVGLRSLFTFCKENYQTNDVSLDGDVLKAYEVYKERGGKRTIDLLEQDLERINSK